MKHLLELRIYKFINPEELEVLIRKPLEDQLASIGRVTVAIPEYQSAQSSSGDLLKVILRDKALYFKYIMVSVSVSNLDSGISAIRKFLTEIELSHLSVLQFADRKYNLLSIEQIQDESILQGQKKMKMQRKNSDTIFYGKGYIVSREGGKYYLEYQFARQGGGSAKLEISQEIYQDARTGEQTISQLFERYNLK